MIIHPPPAYARQEEQCPTDKESGDDGDTDDHAVTSFVECPRARRVAPNCRDACARFDCQCPHASPPERNHGNPTFRATLRACAEVVPASRAEAAFPAISHAVGLKTHCQKI